MISPYMHLYRPNIDRIPCRFSWILTVAFLRLTRDIRCPLRISMSDALVHLQSNCAVHDCSCTRECLWRAVPGRGCLHPRYQRKHNSLAGRSTVGDVADDGGHRGRHSLCILGHSETRHVEAEVLLISLPDAASPSDRPTRPR